jgi:hypothetical protein
VRTWYLTKANVRPAVLSRGRRSAMAEALIL